MASALVALANLTLTGSQTSVTFSSISGSYRDLYLVIAGTSSGSDTLGMQINSDTATNYAFTGMDGNGTSASTTSGNTGIYNYAPLGNMGGGGNYFTTSQSIVTINFMDYTATDKHKTFLSRGNASNAGTAAGVSRWASTSAITTIKIIMGGGSASTFQTGTTFSLYGVKA
jgi:hypothetical protein